MISMYSCTCLIMLTAVHYAGVFRVRTRIAIEYGHRYIDKYAFMFVCIDMYLITDVDCWHL